VVESRGDRAASVRLPAFRASLGPRLVPIVRLWTSWIVGRAPRTPYDVAKPPLQSSDAQTILWIDDLRGSYLPLGGNPMNSYRLLASACACLALLPACRGRLEVPPPQSFFNKWLMLDEPGTRRFGVRDMWDGIQPDGGCYLADTIVVDTINQVRFEVGSASTDASFGAELLNRIGLSAGRKEAQSWALLATGSRIATGRGLRPNLGPECQTKSDGLPRYPVIASMIAFDVMVFGGSDASGRKLDLTKLDLGKFIRLTGGAYEVRDSLLHFQFVAGAWVGYQLWMLKPRQTRHCEWTASLNATQSCPGEDDAFPFAVTVRQLQDGTFRIETRNNIAPNPSLEVDTAGMNTFATIGLPPEVTGTRGEWYSVGILRSIGPSEVRLRLVRRDYDVIRFQTEADRKEFRKAVRR